MSVFYLTNKSNTTVKLSSLGTNGKNMRIQKTGVQPEGAGRVYIDDDRYYYDSPSIVYSKSHPQYQFLASGETLDISAGLHLWFDLLKAKWEVFKVSIDGEGEFKFTTLNLPKEEAMVKYKSMSINLRASSAVSQGVKYTCEHVEEEVKTDAWEDVSIAGDYLVFVGQGPVALKHVHVSAPGCILGASLNNVMVSSSGVFIGSDSENIQIGSKCSNIVIGPGSGKGGRIMIYDDVHNVCLPPGSATGGQVIIESGCGAGSGSLSVETACANGTVLKARNGSFAEGKVVIKGHETDDIFLDGVNEGVFE